MDTLVHRPLSSLMPPSSPESLQSVETGTKIKIKIGTHTFVTTKETLLEAPYFAGYFNEAMGTLPDEEGFYFVDADGDQFEAILTYLRHQKFPLYWTSEGGFGIQAYSRLATQADFFGLDRLYKWIVGQKYKEVITCRQALRLVTITEPADGDVRGLAQGEKILSTHWTVRKQYVCPRGIFVHEGNPSACGRQCRNARDDDGPEYRDMPVLVAAVEGEQVDFHASRLFDHGEPL